MTLLTDQAWERYISVMLRKTADLYNFDHTPCFAVFDTDSRDFEWVEIPHKLAGEVISRDHIDVKEDKRLLLDEFTDAINTELDFTIDLVENMRVFMIENKGELGGDTINILTELINRKEGVE